MGWTALLLVVLCVTITPVGGQGDPSKCDENHDHYGDVTILWASWRLKSAATRMFISTARSVWQPWWRHQMETFTALRTLSEGIHRSPVDSLHKDQWRGASIFSLICTWTQGWANNRYAGDFRRHSAHYDVTVMKLNIKAPHDWLLSKCQ